MRWYWSPACLATILLVIANAIGISVRERRLEMAVLKVLGFRPRQIMVLVLGESVLLGVRGGLSRLRADVCGHQLGTRRHLVSHRISSPASSSRPPRSGGGRPSADWPRLLGSVLPAWSACSVKVAEVFSKVA